MQPLNWDTVTLETKETYPQGPFRQSSRVFSQISRVYPVFMELSLLGCLLCSYILEYVELPWSAPQDLQGLDHTLVPFEKDKCDHTVGVKHA